MRKLRRLLSFPAGERLLLLQLAVFSLALRAALSCVSLPRLVDLLSVGAKTTPLRCFPFGHKSWDSARLTVLADVAARASGAQGQCLARSLLLFWILKARQKPAELLVGVRKNAAIFEAHAWIEVGGEVIGDRVESAGHFTALVRF